MVTIYGHSYDAPGAWEAIAAAIACAVCVYIALRVRDHLRNKWWW